MNLFRPALYLSYRPKRDVGPIDFRFGNTERSDGPLKLGDKFVGGSRSDPDVREYIGGGKARVDGAVKIIDDFSFSLPNPVKWMFLDAVPSAEEENAKLFLVSVSRMFEQDAIKHDQDTQLGEYLRYCCPVIFGKILSEFLCFQQG